MNCTLDLPAEDWILSVAESDEQGVPGTAGWQAWLHREYGIETYILVKDTNNMTCVRLTFTSEQAALVYRLKY